MHSTRKETTGAGGGWKKFRPGSLIGVFKLYILRNKRSWAKFRLGSSRHQNMYAFFAIRGGWGKFRPGLGKLAKRDSEFEFQSVYA